jgi:peptidyl-prolyl cis-trans isomerase B (cyclophilin B)
VKELFVSSKPVSKVHKERLAQYNAHQSVHAHQVARRKRDHWQSALVATVAVAISSFGYFSYFQWGPAEPNPAEIASVVQEIVDTIETGSN